MKIHTMEQRSQEWFKVRASVTITASEVGPFVYKSDKTSEKARKKHIHKRLAAPLYEDDSLLGWEYLNDIKARETANMERNAAVQRGNVLEPDARTTYMALTGARVNEVGIITADDNSAGASPDGLIVDDDGYVGGLEMKCPIPETHIRYLDEQILPPEYEHQVHASLAVSDLPWWDFFSYCPGLPPFLIRVERGKLTDDVSRGLVELHKQYIDTRNRLADEFEQAFDGKWKEVKL